MDESKVKEAKNKELLKLPDTYNFTIEKAVVLYLLELRGNDIFFLSHEKSAIENQMTDCDIDIDLNNFKQNPPEYKIKECKKWCKNNKNIFSKALTRLVRDNEEFYNDFREKLVSLINVKRSNKSLPPVE